MSLSVQKDAAVVFTTQQDIRIKAVMSRSLSVHEKQIYVSCVLSKNICNCGTPAKLQSPFSALFVTYFSSCFFSRSTTTLRREFLSLSDLFPRTGNMSPSFPLLSPLQQSRWPVVRRLATLEEAPRQDSTSPPAPGLASHHSRSQHSGSLSVTRWPLRLTSLGAQMEFSLHT